MVKNIAAIFTNPLTLLTKVRIPTGFCTMCSMITNLAPNNFSYVELYQSIGYKEHDHVDKPH